MGIFFFDLFFTTAGREKINRSKRRQENKWAVFADGGFRISKVFHQEALSRTAVNISYQPPFPLRSLNARLFYEGEMGEKMGENTFEF